MRCCGGAAEYRLSVTRLLILRHGQSEWNALGKWQGRADPPLTELGREQARKAAEALPPFDLLAASTLQRAHQTAQEIAGVVGGAEIVLHEGLVERDAGQFSGLTRSDIEQRFPGYLENGIWPEGWEYDDALVRRVRKVLDHLHQRANGGVVVTVAHGGVIYALEGLFGIPHERIGNLAGRWFEFNGTGELEVGQRVHLLDLAEETIPDQL